jgi:cyclophilin family peptidyl-prolyl cis-trans isomerase
MNAFRKIPLLLPILFTASLCAKSAPSPVVRIETSVGNIDVQLDGKKAPLSVNNFLSYMKKGSYNGTIFHRVISNFMIQGGGFTQEIQKVATDAPIKNEATNGLKNSRGTIAMARTGVVDSATNQFFINVKDNDFLNHRNTSPRGYGYAVFGHVVQGMNVVDLIKESPTGSCGQFSRDCPLDPIIIKKIFILKQ